MWVGCDQIIIIYLVYNALLFPLPYLFAFAGSEKIAFNYLEYQTDIW